jgi:hypothetical protein
MSDCPYCNKWIDKDQLDEAYMYAAPVLPEDESFTYFCPHCGEEIEVIIEDSPVFFLYKIDKNEPNGI